MSRFLQNAILIRIKSKPNYSITKSDIVSFEKKHGKIPSGATIIFATGWNDNPSRKDFFSNPGISESAAKYLVSKRVNLVGIDSPSIDTGNNTKFVAHHVLLKNDVLVLENLCNLAKLNRNFNLVALPLNLKNATGSPVRAIVFLDYKLESAFFVIFVQLACDWDFVATSFAFVGFIQIP